MTEYPPIAPPSEIDRFRNKIARRSVAPPAGRARRNGHQWQELALGRVCDVCLMVQPRGDYNDDIACWPRRRAS